MQLPGGIYDDEGTVAKEGCFKEIDGRLELSIWQARDSHSGSRLACIDRLIDTAFVFDRQSGAASALSVADRQYLMARLAGRLGHGRFWTSAECGGCGTRFDTSVDLDRIPVKPAGDGYPFTTVELSAGPVTIRVPTGADQAGVASIADPMDAIAELARLCIVSPDACLPDAPEALAEDLARIDAALQDIAPEVATSLVTTCPECGAENTTPFDVMTGLLSGLTDPLQEFHDIATAYHWSEAEILALPRDRRRAYLALIDRDNGIER